MCVEKYVFNYIEKKIRNLYGHVRKTGRNGWIPKMNSVRKKSRSYRSLIFNNLFSISLNTWYDNL